MNLLTCLLINHDIPSRASTSQIRETYRCDNIKIDKDNIVKPIRRASSNLDITESEMNFPNGITEMSHGNRRLHLNTDSYYHQAQIRNALRSYSHLLWCEVPKTSIRLTQIKFITFQN
ncbi:hypothetical protein H5410_062787 [Solanum commersonii]|uniref:Uncharacterized protein n=1 Tax=Solanum commersonii TaxID=4109 RepID=A0A9J5WBX7_SOLCO|nr:hypothetical protein H5410_062787 [Solanum commersonii]